MTQPSSPRRATAEPATIDAQEIADVWISTYSEINPDVISPAGRFSLIRMIEGGLRKAEHRVFALPYAHDEAIRAEEREAHAKIADAEAARHSMIAVGDAFESVFHRYQRETAERIAAAIRARASSPRLVPAEVVSLKEQSYMDDDEQRDFLNREVFASDEAPAPAPVRATVEHLVEKIREQLETIVGYGDLSTEPKMLLSRAVDRATLALDALALLPPGTVAPEGWRLVPIFPTETMSNAGTESIEREYTESDWETSKDMAERLNADQVWAAMIAAAPSPPASETA